VVGVFALCMRLASSGFAQESGRATDPSSATPESAGPGFRTGTDAEQLDLLRKLLGVAAPVEEAAPEVELEIVAEPEPVIAPTPDPEPERPAAPEPVRAPVEAPAPAVRPAVPPKPSPQPAVRPAPKPTPRPAAPARPKPAPRPEAPAKPEVPLPIEVDVPAPVEPEVLAPAVYGGRSAESDAPRTPEEARALLQISTTDLPEVGTVLDGRSVERWSHLLTPSMRWSLYRGARIEVSESRPLVMEPWRVEATEKYHAQVRLSEDGKSLLNHVAGIPFPLVTESDPDAALKLIYNFENRIVIDDLEARNFGCETASLNPESGLRVERAGRFGALRRLYYSGRLVVDPKPTRANPDGIRYRESLFPVVDPFNLKGAGFTYARYLDNARQDDAWMYLPANRRVRRLSTAQRSEGIFGVDIDLDSYGGFAGNPAWFEWRLLGKKTLLAPMHAKNEPIKWCDSPAEFMFCDIWEPREMYIVSARSLIPGYNFSLRILYIDAQSMLIPYTEVYDHDGQLWRAYVQQFRSGVDRPTSYATKSVYPVPVIFLGAVTVFDMQLDHASRCQFPMAEDPTEEGWYYWQEAKGGTTEENFDVKMFLNAGC